MADRVTRQASKKQKEEKKVVSSRNQPIGKYLVQNIQGVKENLGVESSASRDTYQYTSSPTATSKMVDRIMKALHSQTELLSREIKELKDSFEQKLVKIERVQQDFGTRLVNFEQSLDFAHAKITCELEKSNSEKDKKIQELQLKLNEASDQNCENKVAINKVEEQLNAQERYERGWNFRIVGIP